jgi:hypothetical protein
VPEERRVGRFYNFKGVRLVRIDVGPAAIHGIADSTVSFTDDHGDRSAISLVECARIYRLLREAHAFPPGDDDDWGILAKLASDFASLELPLQPVVGLRAVIDNPPWFQFLDQRRTQFEFRNYDHIHDALLKPLSAAGNWYSWDAS